MPRLVLDSTGVGVAVTEMFVRALVDYPDVECHSVSITSGEGFSAVSNLTRGNLVARGQWRVSKIQLIASIREVLENRRFKVSKDENGRPIEFAEVLVRELTNFRERITESANMTYEARQGQHDDLVLAACLPIWLGSQRFCTMRKRLEDYPGLQSRERTALEAQQHAIEAAEAEALERDADDAAEEAEDLRHMPSWGVRVNIDAVADPLNERWWDE